MSIFKPRKNAFKEWCNGTKLSKTDGEKQAFITGFNMGWNAKKVDNNMVKKKLEKFEKYYICPECGDLTTETKILEECSNGGMDMCYCKFSVPYWNDELECFDVVFPREYVRYEETGFEFYDFLKDKDTASRLRYFELVPIKLRKTVKPYLAQPLSKDMIKNIPMRD